MTYTVKEISKLASISTRTLHYYDEIDLLKPSIVGDNGYRYYDEKELSKLQIILFYKELDFSLKEIKEMISSPKFNKVSVLEDQKKLIELKMDRLRHISSSLEKAIKEIKGGNEMENNNLFDSLNTEKLDEYKKEAKEKYGEDIVNQSDKNFKKHFKSDPKAVAIEYDRIFTIIKSTGLIDTKDNTVQAAVSELFDLVNKFWDCNLEAFKGLADMYVEDERFKNNYIEKYGENFPEFLKDAMLYFATK